MSLWEAAGADPAFDPLADVQSRRDRTRRRRRAGIVGSLAATALASGLLATVPGNVNALFTDSEDVGANEFATGTLDLSTAPTTAAISYQDMVPGDTTTQPVSVTNDGSTPLRYAVRSTTTENALAGQLDLTVKVGVASCTGTTEFNASGTVLYGPGVLGTTSTEPLVGSSATGSDPGDRTLAPGASETLCLHVALPTASSNTYQGLATTATFQFVAEQTANNP